MVSDDSTSRVMVLPVTMEVESQSGIYGAEQAEQMREMQLTGLDKDLHGDGMKSALLEGMFFLGIRWKKRSGAERSAYL